MTSNHVPICSCFMCLSRSVKRRIAGSRSAETNLALSANEKTENKKMRISYFFLSVFR